MPTLSSPNPWLHLVDEVYKAHATRPVPKRTTWRGLQISIENPAGSERRGKDADGTPWVTVMKNDYGYIRGTQSPEDGDHLDVFLAQDPLDHGSVYVVHTTHPHTGEYDEDKHMVGFVDREAALSCFMQHYDEPHKHFGAISSVDVGTFADFCKAGKANWGRPLVPGAAVKVKLNRRRFGRLAQAKADRIAWMKGRVAKGRSPEEIVEDAVATGFGHLLTSGVEKSVALFAEAVSVGKAAPISDSSGKRLILIEPGFDVIDPQGDWIPLSTIAHAWAYYEVSGNVDLEHISKKGGKTYEETKALIAMQGFEPEHAFARVQYEIGRPVKNSICVTLADGTELVGTAALKQHAGQELAVVKLSYIAEIFRNNEAADWFWKTWAEQDPPLPWRPSVAGSMLAVETQLESDDPVLNIKGQRTTKIARRFLWNNTAMTQEPVNYLAPVIQTPTDAHLRRHQILKGVLIMDPHTDTVSSLEVVKSVMLQAGVSALNDMRDSGQLDTSAYVTMLGDVTKSVQTLSEEVFAVEVSKALDYGAVTTDSSLLSQGGAASGESFDPENLTDYRRELIARDLYKATLEGYSPISKGVGYEPPADPEDYLAEVGDCVQINYACSTDDAHWVASRFIQLVLGE